jgi:hypothetical protein
VGVFRGRREGVLTTRAGRRLAERFAPAADRLQSASRRTSMRKALIVAATLIAPTVAPATTIIIEG